MYRYSYEKRQQGFTLVELLIVIVVIAILAAITIVAYNAIIGKANNSATLSGAQQAGKKIGTWSVANSDGLLADKSSLGSQAGVADGNGTSYQYSVNTASSPNSYCLTITQGTTSAHIAGFSGGAVNSATTGPCPGHTGMAPSTLADGSSCPANYIVVPGSSLFGTKAFCVMKYEARNDGSGNAISTASGTPWASITQSNAAAAASAACSGCHLITEAEWLTIAQNVLSVASNWSGGSVGSGFVYSGHNDSAPASLLASDTNDSNGYANETNTGGNQRRTLTLTNGNVIWDFAGNAYEWTSAQTTGNQPGNPGFAWRQWNAGLSNGSLSVNPSPVYSNASAASWSSTQGMGQVYSATDDTSLRVFARGGNWAAGANAGIYALNLVYIPGASSSSIGFRVSR